MLDVTVTNVGVCCHEAGRGWDAYRTGGERIRLLRIGEAGPGNSAGDGTLPTEWVGEGFFKNFNGAPTNPFVEVFAICVDGP